MIIAVGLLASCAQTSDVGGPGATASPSGGDDPVASDPVRPVGGDLRIGEPWYLLGASVSSVQMPGGVTMTFEEKTVSGKAPVNSFSGEYTATSTGGLTFGDLAMTLMAGPEDLMQAESAFMALLGTVDGYTTVGAGELYLFDDQAQVLTFTTTEQPDPATLAATAEAMATTVVGMGETEAQTAVEEAGLTWRVVSRDGEDFAVTEDYSTSRINATIVDGKVTAATVG